MNFTLQNDCRRAPEALLKPLHVRVLAGDGINVSYFYKMSEL
jgi:hypothetical protein